MSDLKANFIHALTCLTVFAIGLTSFALAWPPELSWLAIAGVLIYLAAILIEVGSRYKDPNPPHRAVLSHFGIPLPTKLFSLVLFFIVLFTVVLSYSNLFIQSQGIRATSNVIALSSGGDTTDESEPKVLNDKVDAIYFSMVTLLTVGYGDYAPTTKLARGLVVAELLNGIILVLTTLSLIVSRLANIE